MKDKIIHLKDYPRNPVLWLPDRPKATVLPLRTSEDGAKETSDPVCPFCCRTAKDEETRQWVMEAKKYVAMVEEILKLQKQIKMIHDRTFLFLGLMSK